MTRHREMNLYLLVIFLLSFAFTIRELTHSERAYNARQRAKADTEYIQSLYLTIADERIANELAIERAANSCVD